MNLALVGNNDGPLTLLGSLKQPEINPVCVGLQKAVPEDLNSQYLNHVSEDRFFSGFSEDKLLERLALFPINLVVNCFCNFKFTRLLEQYEILNVHLAPLPRYRGRHPLHWALINGETEFGLTIHRMTPEIDAGDILWQRMVAVQPGTSVATLREQLMRELAMGFGTFVQQYQAGAIDPQPNREGDATYVARRFPADSELTEWHDRDTIYRKVMALRSEVNPAFLRVGEQAIPIKQAELSSRYYVGRSVPFISRVLADGIEVVGYDGRSIVLRGLDPRIHSLRLNQRLT